MSSDAGHQPRDYITSLGLYVQWCWAQAWDYLSSDAGHKTGIICPVMLGTSLGLFVQWSWAQAWDYMSSDVGHKPGIICRVMLGTRLGLFVQWSWAQAWDYLSSEAGHKPGIICPVKLGTSLGLFVQWCWAQAYDQLWTIDIHRYILGLTTVVMTHCLEPLVSITLLAAAWMTSYSCLHNSPWCCLDG